MGVVSRQSICRQTCAHFEMGSKNGKPVLTEEMITSVVNSTDLDAVEVKEFWDGYILAMPDGRINKKEFSEAMAKMNPGTDVNKIEEHTFRIYDTNNDGKIDFVEFMIVFYINSNGTAREILTRIFRVFDVNSDGFITKKEMTRLVKDMYCLLNNENAEQASKDLIAKSAFAEMDKDEDGKITTEEFITACLAEEKFSKILAVKVMNMFLKDGEAKLQDY